MKQSLPSTPQTSASSPIFYWNMRNFWLRSIEMCNTLRNCCWIILGIIRIVRGCLLGCWSFIRNLWRLRMAVRKGRKLGISLWRICCWGWGKFGNLVVRKLISMFMSMIITQTSPKIYPPPNHNHNPTNTIPCPNNTNQQKESRAITCAHT